MSGRAATTRRSRRWLRLLLAALALVPWPEAAAALSPIEQGMRVQDALRVLQRDGVRVVFSTALVPLPLCVVAAPRDGPPEQVLRELLAPHGLDVKPALGQRWLVVREPVRNPVRDAEAEARRQLKKYVATEAITVEASSPPLVDARTGVRTFDRASMPQLTSSTALHDALAALPGTSGSELAGAALVRGAGPGETEMLLDGVDVQAAPRLRGLQGLLGIVDAQAIDKVELLAGGYPAHVGGSLGGVVNLVPDARHEKRTEVGIGTFGARLLSSGRAGERAGWLLTARSGELGEGIATEHTIYQGLEPRYLDVFGRVERRLGAGGALSASAYYANDRVELALTPRQTIAQRDERASAWVDVEAPWTARILGRSRLVYGRGQGEHDVLTELPAEAGVAAPRRRRTQETVSDRVELAQEWSLRGGRHAPRAGLLVRGEWARAHEREARSGAVPDGVLLLPLAHEGLALETYLTDVVDLGRGRSLEAGLRVERQSWTGTTWSPRLNLAWPLLGGDLRVGAGRFAQAQHLYETRLEPGLREPQAPQIADQVVLGYDRRWGRTAVQVEAYHTEARQLWPRFERQLGGPTELVGEVGTAELVRPRKARLRGVELLASSRLTARLDGLLSYSWSDAVEDVAGETVRRDWDQRHAFDGHLAWRPHLRLGLQLRGLYASGWPYTASTASAQLDDRQHPVVIVSQGPRNGEERPSTWRLDVGATVDVPVRGSSIEVELAVLNLTDHGNVAAVAGFEPEALLGEPAQSRRVDVMGLRRTAALSLTWRF